MTYHVITARVYTGKTYYLCEGQEGKLGGWCKQVVECKQFNKPTDADEIFNAINSIIDRHGRSSTIDSSLFKFFEDRARLIELGVGKMDNTLVVCRRRIIDIGRQKDPFGDTVMQLTH